MVVTRQQSAANDNTATIMSNMSTATENIILEKLNSIEDKLNELGPIKSTLVKIQEDYTELKEKVDAVQALPARVTAVEEKVNSMQSLKAEYEEAIRQYNLKSLLQECHSKRQNVLVFNIPQVEVWEKILDSEKKVREFLRDIVKVDEADTCVIADCHRLRTAKMRMPLPLIFKVGSMTLKRKIADNLKNLTTYNAGKEKKNKVFVELMHLPKRLSDDKKLLQTQFDDARIAKRRPTWIRNDEVGMLCLKIGGVIIAPDRK